MTVPTKEESDAITAFALSVTVPIFRETHDGAELLASGTLFEVAGLKFVITARHIFDVVSDPKKLAYAESRSKGDMHTFGNFQIGKPTEKHFDVAVMALQSNETISKLKAGWRFLSLENVSVPSSSASDGSILLAGYPCARTQKSDRWLRGSFLAVYTQRFLKPPSEAEEPINPGLDLFFDYAREATSITGTPVATPELEGCSGASVWEYRRSSSPIWTAESAVRVVAVQSAYVHSKYFRAINWLAVAKVLEMIDPKIATEIASYLKSC